MQNHIRFILCLIILLALFVRPAPAFACSCIMPGSPPVEFAQADAVFRGQVLSMVDKQNVITSLLQRVLDWIGLPARYRFNPALYGYRVTFHVSSSWKGARTTVTQVTTGYGGGDCGYPFQVGTNYVIYAYGHPNNLNASICSRTAELSQATADLHYLNTLQSLPLSSVRSTPWLLVGSIVFLVIISAIAVFWLVQRLRQLKP